MNWDWFNTAAGAASLLGLWVTLAALILGWWWSRSASTLIAQTTGKTQELITTSATDTKTLLARMDEHWRQAWERMDQRADERHREVIQAIQALKS